MIQFPNVDLTDITGVMIDLDNTLYDYDAAHGQSIDTCAKHFIGEYNPTNNPTNNPTDINTFKTDYRAHRTRVTNYHKPTGVARSRLLAFLGVFEQYALPHAWDIAKQYNDMYWQVFYQTMAIDDKASAFLHRCKNIPVCVVTDMEMGVQVRKLRALGCENHIDFMVSSEETGAEKPAPIMFEQALAKLQSHNPEITFHTCIMIGDSQEKDIEGAEKIGIRAQKVIIT